MVSVLRHQENHLLKQVSRSFYLSLRLLPKEMRPAASLGYLLARLSDTIADTKGVSGDDRLEGLELFMSAVKGTGQMPEWSVAWRDGCVKEEELILLDSGEHLVELLGEMREVERRLVLEVLETIVSGQRMDIEWDCDGESRGVQMESGEKLEDYTWRVAGCVGAFWTQLGFLTLGKSFATKGLAEMEALGIQFGKGLQLVNILRDVHVDLEMGRRYLPMKEEAGGEAWMRGYHQWLVRAREWVSAGLPYAKALPMRRLRAATVLPAYLAVETLDALERATFKDLKQRIKLPRRRVYACLWRSFWG
jgi:farnesyl-diphosphate farnesyltransferase